MINENVFVQIPHFIFAKDIDSKYLWGNNFSVAGFATADDIVGKCDHDCIWHEYADLYREGDMAALDGIIVQNQIEPQIQVDGVVRTIMTSKSRLYDMHNQVLGVVGSYTEIVDKSYTGQFKENAKNIILTEKEVNCLVMLVMGYAPKEIADILRLSVRTIVHRIDNIKKKLHCYSKADLIKKALTLPFIKNRLLVNLFAP